MKDLPYNGHDLGLKQRLIILIEFKEIVAEVNFILLAWIALQVLQQCLIETKILLYGVFVEKQIFAEEDEYLLSPLCLEHAWSNFKFAEDLEHKISVVPV
jgi:hypothetical protein